MAPRSYKGLPRSHKGRWRRVLELLVEGGGAMRRAALKDRLEALSESHLSHLLRDLEEAEMIVRRRPERSREVLVELLPAGREIVAARASSERAQPAEDRPTEGRSTEDEPTEDEDADSPGWAPWLD